MKHALICDLDMTLIDSARDIAEALAHTLSKIGKKTFTMDQVLPLIGRGIQEMFNELLPEIKVGFDQKTFMDGLRVYQAYYGEHCNVHTTLYPGVLDTLTRLKDNGVPMAVATNKWGAMARQVCRKMDLEGYFSHFQGTEELVGKPDPAVILHACQALNVQPDQALYVGDKVSDIQAGKRAGCTMAAVTYGVGSADELAAHQPDRLINAFSEILSFFD